jgi:glycosyltransferase involved in cell wall biosynthesis
MGDGRYIRVLEVSEATAGGVRRHLRDLACGLAGCRVSFAVSCERDGGFREDVAAFRAKGIVCHEIPMERRIAPFADAASLCALVRAVRQDRPDVIHAHSSKAGFLAREAGRLCKVPVVYTPHVFPFLMQCGGFRRLYRALERLAVPWTAAVIVLSQEERDAALSLGFPESRVYLIPNGICPGPLASRVPPPAGKTFHVGFFGRFCFQKGADLLPSIIHAAEGMRFFCYGDGGLLDSVRGQCEADFFGAYRQGSAVGLMQALDAVVVPSRWEGCPYVVLEAWEAGVPVVASGVGGITDLIQDGRNGVLVPGTDVAAWAKALAGLAGDPVKWSALVEGGRASLKEYALAKMVEATESVYREVCGNGNPGHCG